MLSSSICKKNYSLGNSEFFYVICGYSFMLHPKVFAPCPNPSTISFMLYGNLYVICCTSVFQHMVSADMCWSWDFSMLKRWSAEFLYYAFILFMKHEILLIWFLILENTEWRNLPRKILLKFFQNFRNGSKWSIYTYVWVIAYSEQYFFPLHDFLDDTEWRNLQPNISRHFFKKLQKWFQMV